MRFRPTLGATLLAAVAALTADPAFAQDRRPFGTLCVENAGAFVIEASFDFFPNTILDLDQPVRSVNVGSYPVLQTRCTEFTESEGYARIVVKVLAGYGKDCLLDLRRRYGGRIPEGSTLTAKIHGTTLINQLECRV